MNIIFFFIPFLIVAGSGIYQDSFALESYRGETWLDVTNPDGSHTRTFGLAPYIFDGNNYVPFIFTDGTNKKIETNHGSVILNPDGIFSFYKTGKITEGVKFTDRIIAKYADVTDLNSWTYLNSLNNDTPDISWDGEALVSSKVNTVGQLDYKFILNDGSWKTQLEATNLSALTTKAFGFDQIIELNSDTIKFGGVTRNLDNFNGMTFNKEFLDNNRGKVLNLLNGINFDFDLGFDNLYSITVYDTGANKSRLVFDYRTSTPLLPGQTLIIDPTYTTVSTYDISIRDDNNNDVCNDTGGTYTIFDDASELFIAYVYPTSNTNDCQRGAIEFDISSATTDWIVSAVDFLWDGENVGSVRVVDVYSMPLQPNGRTAAQIFDEVDDGTILLNDSSAFASTGDSQSVSLGATGVTTLQSAIDGSQTWYALGFRFNDETLDASHHFIDIAPEDKVTANPKPTLSITYSTSPVPDAITDLTSLSQSYGTVDLTWTLPGLNGGNVSGHQINYTTPFGNPLTIITNDTGSATTSTSVTGLSTGTPYTFGVSVWTEGGNNATHPPMKWFNITTSGNFSIGTATFNQTNPFVLPITFETQTINSTAEFLNVTYSNTFDLSCDFHYKFANTNQTYSNLASYAVSSTLDEASFVLTNGTNEIIDVYCWDNITDTNARYLLKQTDFPILDQILGFRSGDYGTQGMFGVFDLVTLLVIIGSMIGLNRENESVGIVFNVMLMFGLSFFGIIELTTVIFGMIALVLVFVVTSTKKS